MLSAILYMRMHQLHGIYIYMLQSLVAITATAATTLKIMKRAVVDQSGYPRHTDGYPRCFRYMCLARCPC